MSFHQAFESFMASSFTVAADSATKASWGGSGYSVELLESGEYRVLWNGQIGNLYDSPGILLAVPPLSSEEWDDDPSIRFYDNCEEAIRANFEELSTKTL